mgnify:CR=1 FL=1
MFIVLETQTNTDGTVGIVPTAFYDELEAKSKYHQILSAAAISTLPRHTAFILTDDGYVIQSECFM